LGVSRHVQINREFSLIGAKLSAEGKTMADLRITGVTNNQLELQAPDGTRHYLEITEDLLKALKPKPIALPPSLSPREIQAEIRLGTTVAELVARTGVSEELVARFAAPIVSELGHIVVLARNIRLSLAGDRFTEPTQIEFGTVMDERLAANGATNVNWTAKKSLDGDWLVSASYSHNSSNGRATWSFDPKNLFLVPENQSAMQLSNALPLSNVVEIENVPVEAARVEPTVISSIEPEAPETSTQTAGLSIVPELVQTAVTDETETELISLVETEIRTAFHVVQDSIAEDLEDRFQEVHETFEETRIVLEDEQLDAQDEEFQHEQQNQDEDVLEAEPTPAPKVQSTSRWAEVLFGTKIEDDES
jgi:hypothetical protein